MQSARSPIRRYLYEEDALSSFRSKLVGPSPTIQNPRKRSVPWQWELPRSFVSYGAEVTPHSDHRAVLLRVCRKCGDCERQDTWVSYGWYNDGLISDACMYTLYESTPKGWLYLKCRRMRSRAGCQGKMSWKRSSEA